MDDESVKFLAEWMTNLPNPLKEIPLINLAIPGNFLYERRDVFLLTKKTHFRWYLLQNPLWKNSPIELCSFWVYFRKPWFDVIWYQAWGWYCTGCYKHRKPSISSDSVRCTPLGNDPKFKCSWPIDLWYSVRTPTCICYEERNRWLFINLIQ